jgi:poly(hydroxyalkanoate) depolymerase family esterase
MICSGGTGLLPSLATVAAALLSIASPAAGQQAFLDRTDRSPPYWLFLPPDQDPSTPVPLVIMLHGCRQDAEALAKVTRMNEVAARHGFAVLYPEQTAMANPLRCWRWYEPAHQTRGDGEPAVIAGLIDTVGARDDVTVDDDRIYVAGLSAGASMAAVLGATYPDVFAAVETVAGVPYGAAADCLSGYNAMQRIWARMWTLNVVDAWGDYWKAYSNCAWTGELDPRLAAVPAPDKLGELVFATMGTAARVVPVVVFQGTADETVSTDQRMGHSGPVGAGRRPRSGRHRR